MIENLKSIKKNRTIIVPSISYFALFKFATKRDKLLISIAFISIFIAGLTMPYSIALVANVFQSMIDYAKSNKDQFYTRLFLKSMQQFGIKYTCVGVLLLISGYLGSALMNVAAINQIFKIRISYLRAVLNQDLVYYDLHQTGDFASKMAEDMIKVEEGIGDKVSALLYNIAVSISCIVMTLMKGWKLALLCLSTAPITFLLVGLTGAISNRLYKKQAQAKGAANAVAEEALSSIKTVYAFNGQEKEIERYRRSLIDARRIHIQKEFFTGLSMGFLFLCVFISYALAFYLGIYLIINEPDRYNADVMFSVFFGVMTALSYFGMIGNLMTSLGSARGAGASIFYVLHSRPIINPLLDRGIKPELMEGDIDFKNVYFEYPSRPGIKVLSGVSINILRGQSVALVGQSGCGKSTVVALISRYYDVVDGSVRVNGYDVRELSVRWLRDQVGLVQQEPVLFNTSIRENIRYGYKFASNDDILKAAQIAYAHDFIMMLPAGYDTLVGDRGTALSGGQKQRIAIARALVRNPRILILDEATSALDTLSESKVQEALNKATKGRITIIVAHRLSTIRNVDVIYVMKQGQVVESGNHEELMIRKGFYYEMFKASELSNLSQPDVSNGMEADASLQNLSEMSKVIINSKDKILERSIVVTDSMANHDPDYLIIKVKTISYICVSIGCVTGFSHLIETYSFGKAGAYLTERLRLQMFTHFLSQDVAYFDERANSTGALCARLSAEAAYVQGATGQRIGILLQALGSVGFALLLAVWFQWRVALVALAFLPLLILVTWQQGLATDKESSGYVKSLENSTKIAVEAVSNIRTVASLGRESYIVQQYAEQLSHATLPARRAAHWRGLMNGLSKSIFNFVNVAALTYGGHLIAADGTAYQNILIATQALQLASSQAQNAFAYAPDFQKGNKAATRIIELLKTKPKITNPDKPVESFKATGDACLIGVRFKYPSRPNTKVLRNLHLKINRGKTIAIVGQSGCGKSTIIQLLQRYYDPDAGNVFLDDITLDKLRLSDVRASFGLVSQEPVLFDRSIRENIAYGDNSRVVLEGEIIAAAKQANIHDFIVSLPMGYETEIGAKGVQLSGGQKQRVAIARALIRHPAILLLDEATSALDNESEKVVQATLLGARADRTCVLIAHRLSTVRDAQEICVLRAGRVAEQGTHTELVKLGGLYSNLLSKGFK
ncbi:ATP-dependent translocase ABCB1-like [Melitaea cinxia]|uniref:ATP-dependent translocase ABCB1-like n=1 Tax=Melitaea cinxia TaxID=113334 RepID=UPI001E27433B|nr:ATP-dependent translocase ABCB1-like [Melitaea cinxia]